jgi:DNA-binding transcriptional MerR regulator
MKSLNIGAVSRATGIKIPTIRYYESTGLLPAPTRQPNGRRIYDEHTIRRLSLIRNAREMDFSQHDIRALLRLQDSPQQPCEKADAIASARIQDIQKRIQRLSALKSELESILSCCAHKRIETCHVLRTLAEPARTS